MSLCTPVCFRMQDFEFEDDDKKTEDQVEEIVRASQVIELP